MSDQVPQRDPKATARQMFESPDDQADLVEIGERYSSEAEEVTRILLDAIRLVHL